MGEKRATLALPPWHGSACHAGRAPSQPSAGSYLFALADKLLQLGRQNAVRTTQMHPITVPVLVPDGMQCQAALMPHLPALAEQLLQLGMPCLPPLRGIGHIVHCLHERCQLLILQQGCQGGSQLRAPWAVVLAAQPEGEEELLLVVARQHLQGAGAELEANQQAAAGFGCCPAL